MKKFLKLESLTHRTPPEQLDRRILMAAAAEAAGWRWRRQLRRVLSAAAALLLAAGVFLLLPERAWNDQPGNHPQPANTNQFDQEQLLALADWSRIDQDGYNQSCELNAGQIRINEMAGERILAGF